MDFKWVETILLGSLLINHVSSNQQMVNKCGSASKNQVRHFLNINQLRGNEISFNVDSPDFQGNSVEFNFTNLIKLEKNSFICNSCEFIINLNLSSKNIEIIDEGAFINLPCLKQLDLSENKITNVSQNELGGCPNLEILNLNSNNIGVIYNMTFGYLKSLTQLFLSNNNIKTLERNSFYNLPQLQILNLSHNNLGHLNLDIFQTLNKLNKLYLNSNKLFKIEPATVVNTLNNLKLIDLSGNEIIEELTNIELPLLETMYINKNYLEHFNVTVLKLKFPRLKYIEINKNLWNCKHLKTLEKQLQEYEIDYGKPIECIVKVDIDDDNFLTDILHKVIVTQILIVIIVVILFAFILLCIFNYVCAHIGLMKKFTYLRRDTTFNDDDFGLINS